MLRTACLAFLAAASVAGAVATPVLAQTVGQPLRIVVNAKDLDLANPTDAGTFYHRLQMAAAEVCGGTSAYYLGDRPDHMVNCYQTIMSDAVGRLSKPLVTAQFDREHPRMASR
jgi:UrcA family protein